MIQCNNSLNLTKACGIQLAKSNFDYVPLQMSFSVCETRPKHQHEFHTSQVQNTYLASGP